MPRATDHPAMGQIAGTAPETRIVRLPRRAGKPPCVVGLNRVSQAPEGPG